jgi:type I restriction enzyme S subunit
MPIKKSDLYSSIWASCDELRGGMDAGQYKDYVLFMLFIKYITDKYGNSSDFAPPVTIPKGASFTDMIALKGKPDIGDKINTQIIQPLKMGDVLFNRTSETEADLGLAAAFVGAERAVFGGFVIRGRPTDERLDPTYAGYALRASHIRSQIIPLGQGAIRANIGQHSLRRVVAPVPPKSEQRAIAAALSDVDGLLGGLDRLIAKKRDLKQAAMQQLLTGETRLPGFHGEWEVKRLGEVAEIQRGASPRPIDSPVWFDDNSSIGWVRISDVTQSGMFLHETTQRLSPLGVQHSRPVASDTLIMSICATVGRPIITKIDVCIHDGFVVFESLQADKLFLYYVLKWIEPNWSKHGQTGSQMNLNTGLITGTSISLPPRSEQTAIVTVLSDMDAELAALEARRDKTRALKQAMMQELLSGKTRLIAPGTAANTEVIA